MKKTIITIIAVFIIYAGFGQTSNDYQKKLDSISAVVIHYFQVKQADSIYALAGQSFRSQLTQANFKSIAETQIFPLNNFQQVTFISNNNGINKYKIAGSPELQLLVSLDKENKLETLLLQPFSNN